MSRRFFTSDWHLGMSILLNKEIMKQKARPFKTVEKMNDNFINSCISCTSEDDVIIHVGDLCCYKKDRDNFGLSYNPQDIISKIPATFINVRGNHDINNKVKSLCESMRTRLGKRFMDVSISHYPSYSQHSQGHFQQGDIHLCGHVHSSWKHCLDITNQVLNINVGVDVWDYKIVAEEELIQYINSILKLPVEKLNKVEIDKNYTLTRNT